MILSYASKGREDYPAMLKRLQESLDKNYTGEYYLHDQTTMGDIPQPNLFECKRHSEIPYQFKYGLIQYFRERGHKRIIWLDSSFTITKDPFELLDGVMAFDNLGHPLPNYIADHAVANLGNPDINIPQTWGGAIGFDFNLEWVCNLFSEIVHHSLIGSFNEGSSSRPGFIAHRHDQAVMSVLFHKHRVPLIPYGKIVTHPHHKPPYEYGTDFYLIHGHL